MLVDPPIVSRTNVFAISRPGALQPADVFLRISPECRKSTQWRSAQ